MLNKIILENFKASRFLPARLSNITVLAGLNSSGKSTLLQAIGAIRQSYTADEEPYGLSLKGNLVQLGRYRDVHTEGVQGDDISITIVENDIKYLWECSGVADDDILSFKTIPKRTPEFVRSPYFQYLQADRLVPRTLYPEASKDARDSRFLGIHGEFTVDYLAEPSIARKHVSRRRLYRKSPYIKNSILSKKIAQTPRLLDQVNGWLQNISPGVRLFAESIRGTDEVLLQYGYVGRRGITNSAMQHRPSNIGFGVTYCLPVIVACLIAEENSLLLLENPEAHLNPAGQAALGELLARTADDGIQIIVETHSDHLLNGIRLSVKRKLLNAEKVALHFFSKSPKDGYVNAKSPTLLENGRLSNWPEGFFDQWDKAVDALLD